MIQKVWGVPRRSSLPQSYARESIGFPLWRPNLCGSSRCHCGSLHALQLSRKTCNARDPIVLLTGGRLGTDWLALAETSLAYR
jgi:hypothetical protein